MRGWVPFQSQALGPLSFYRAGSPFYSAGLGPLSSSGAGSPFKFRGWVPFHYMGLGPPSISGAGSPFNLRGWVPFHYMGLGPLSISGAGSLFMIWGWVPFHYMGLGPLSISGAGSPFMIWGWVPFQAMGLNPLLQCGAGSPFTVWGWVPLQLIGGRIYCRYPAPWSTRPPSAAHSMCGSVPLLIQISGAGSPFTVWGWVPFYSMGLGPLLLYGAGSPLNQWGCVPLQSMGGRISCRYLAPWSTRPPSTTHNMCGFVPLMIQILAAGSPFTLWGWVPFYSMALGPLSISGAGSPCNRMAGGSIADTWLPGAPVRLLRRTACVVLSHC